MLTIKGHVRDGLVYPAEPVAGYNEEEVLITFLNERVLSQNAQQEDVPTNWDALDRIIDENQMDTGIPDLAHQHDHYIHGTPKRN